MVTIGYIALVISFVAAVYAGIMFAAAARGKGADLRQSAENASRLVLFFLSLSFVALGWLIVSHDFSIRYVYEHSDRSTPLFYLISALWAGQEGSLLFWGWLLAVFGGGVMATGRRRDPDLTAYAMSVIMITTAFFLLLNLASANPFTLFPDGAIPIDGHGMNPLLLHPAMVIHPPLILAGYVGFTVPFAFALAALFSGQLGEAWIRTTRRWTILAWLFLGTGIILGAKWAYVELGWGGYWAWDPVENASLMPWLTGTAFLHSVIIQEKKGMLKIWNVSLVTITFLLCVFGTFITRSGVMSSVHAFGESTLGPFFVVFLVLAALVSTFAIVKQRALLRSRDRLDAIASRETSVLVNNYAFLGMTFAVLWGTIFPMISEAVRGVKTTVAAPYFNKVTFPIALAVLFLTGAGPLFAWRRTSMASLRRSFLVPSAAALAVGIVLAAFGVREFIPLSQLTLCAFVVFTIYAEFHRGVRARQSATGEPVLTALGRLTLRNRRRYGGYIVHLSIVMVFIGIAGGAFNRSVEVEVEKGGSFSIGNYRLVYESMSETNDDTKSAIAANLIVDDKNGRRIATLRPAQRYYRRQEQTTTEVAIHSSLKEDLYLILAGQNSSGDRAAFKAFLNPLVSWLWIGGILLSLATVFTIWPEGEKRRTPGKGTNAPAERRTRVPV